MAVTRLFYCATCISGARPPSQAPSPGPGGRRPAPRNATAKVGPPASLVALKLPARPLQARLAQYAGRAPPPALAPMAGGARVDLRRGPRGRREQVLDHQGHRVRRRDGRTPCSSPAHGYPAEYRSAFVLPRPPRGGGAAPNLAHYPDLATRTCSATRSRGGRSPRTPRSNGTRYPGRPVSTSRYAPGMAVPDPGDARSGSRDRGTGLPREGNVAGTDAAPPARRVALTGSTGSYFAGSSPVHPVHAQGAPRAPGSPTCSSPTYRYTASRYAPVLPVSARGARRTSRRRMRTPPVPVSHGRTGGGVPGTGPELFVTAPAAYSRRGRGVRPGRQEG